MVTLVPQFAALLRQAQATPTATPDTPAGDVGEGTHLASPAEPLKLSAGLMSLIRKRQAALLVGRPADLTGDANG